MIGQFIITKQGVTVEAGSGETVMLASSLGLIPYVIKENRAGNRTGATIRSGIRVSLTEVVDRIRILARVPRILCKWG